MANLAARVVRRTRRYGRTAGQRMGLIPYPGPAWPKAWSPSLADRLLRRPRPPIQAMTRAEFASLHKRHAWYKIRGPYMSAASLVAAELIERDGLRNALELDGAQRARGARGCP